MSFVMETVLEEAKKVTSGKKPVRMLRLTRREMEVIALIAQGDSSKEAADKLFISKRTVDFHLANIYDKVENLVGCDGNRNRIWAIRWIKRLGLLPFEPGEALFLN